MAWTEIPDDNLSPGAPARSADMIAIRDNFEALANGDEGAPKVQTAAVQDEAVTNAKIDNGAVTSNKLNSALYSTGAVGTYAFLRNDGVSSNINPGQNVPGSALRYANASGVASGTPGGTWRCMGRANGTQFTESFSPRTTLFLRIS